MSDGPYSRQENKTRKKLNYEDLKSIVDLSKNKTTRRIISIMNFRLAKRDEVYKTEKNIGKHLTIGKTMI